MNIKFNLGNINVKVGETEHSPEINAQVENITYEVTELSLTEYGSVLKTVAGEVGSLMKEFNKIQQESQDKELERQERIHAMRMEEINARHSDESLLRKATPVLPV
ncbi:hypothetical protein C2I27_03830 [Priestia megaterium]|uniref:hypothetical protein n=1 Tax=Priestia megaterium TaxID=1404 RepID=UPI000D50F9BD|nr:hypothetical protein [Priestia megaterium]PVC75026.1 hypothetical protein C2I27_03830 [Priestia megaterium]